MADADQIATVHDAALIDAVQRAGRTGAAELQVGLGSDDNPVFLGHARGRGARRRGQPRGVPAGWTAGVAARANITGGLHHAMRDRASGFCVYNDVAIGIQWLLDQGAERVAYVDVDVHHGDGVEAIFWDDPRVLTISLHETGQFLFPGTGFSDDLGGEGAGAPRSTSRCRPAPATPAGCGPSTPSSPTWCASSTPTSWSPSTAATRTPTTRWPT